MVRAHHALQLLGRLRQRDVETALAAFGAGDEEAQRERRLAGARRALEQVDAVARQAAAQDRVEAVDAGRSARSAAARAPAASTRSGGAFNGVLMDARDGETTRRHDSGRGYAAG